MADLEFKINGIDGLINKLKDLPDKLQKKGAKAAARKAMNIVRNAARDKAKQIDDRDTPEAIWRNIITQDSPRSGNKIGGVAMRVGVRGGARTSGGAQRTAANRSNPGGDTRYWRHVEFGTEDTPAQPFMRPALENNIDRVTETLVRELWNEIDKAIPK